MIDTIQIVKNITQEEREHLLQVLALKTKSGSFIYYPSDSKLVVNSYKNLKLLLADNKLTISGSLTKLHYANNIQQLTYNQLIDLLKSLETLLSFPLDDAIIKRIDIACNVEADEQVSSYLALLFPPKGHKLTHYESETKYFQNGNKTYCIYDKNKEAKKTAGYLMSTGSLIRYELRVKKNVAKELGWQDAKLSNLYDLESYIKLINWFWMAFCKIPFKKELQDAPLDFTNIKRLKNQLIADGIKYNGGEEVLYSAIKSPHVKRTVRFAIRKMISDIPDGKIINWNLIDELGVKISAKCQREVYTAIHYSNDPTFDAK
jgi:hypothetical protein